MRLLSLAESCIETFELNLSGYTVFTEAASGNFAVTPISALLAGAEKVYAVARDSRYGSVEEVSAHLLQLARKAGVEKRLAITRDFSDLGKADIITNLGFLRPIDASKISLLKPHELGYEVVGCSRSEADYTLEHYRHYCVDVADEGAVRNMMRDVRKRYGRLDVLLNNAGIASMNHGREDVSAEAQRILEEQTANLIYPWLEKENTRNLSCAGGVFLNVKLNQRIWESGNVKKQHIYPNCGDSGLAAGAALHD